MPGPEGEMHPGESEYIPPPFVESDLLQVIVNPTTYARRETHIPEIIETKFLFELDQGLSPYEPPAEVEEFLKEYRETGQDYLDMKSYADIDMSPADKFIRDRFGLSKNPVIVFTPGGSDTFLDRLPQLFPKSDFELTVLGPAFQTMVNSVNKFAPENVRLISGDLEKGMKDTIRQAMQIAGEERDENATKNRIFFMCSPASPTGEVIPVTDIEQLGLECAMHGITLVVDEVAGDFLPVENSIIKLVETMPNMIGLRSFSKGMHLPALPGWAVMSPEQGEKFKDLPYVGRQNPVGMRLANVVMDPNIYLPYLEETGEKVEEVKRKFIEYIKILGLDVLPTHNRVLYFAVKGKSPDFYQKVIKKGVKVVDGKTFNVTHTGIDSSIIRISTPATEEEAKEVALILADAEGLLAA